MKMKTWQKPTIRTLEESELLKQLAAKANSGGPAHTDGHTNSHTNSPH